MADGPPRSPAGDIGDVPGIDAGSAMLGDLAAGHAVPDGMGCRPLTYGRRMDVDLPVEDDHHVVRAADAEVVGGEGLEERPGMAGAVKVMVTGSPAESSTSAVRGGASQVLHQTTFAGRTCG
jgi:hypothetical protein